MNKQTITKIVQEYQAELRLDLWTINVDWDAQVEEGHYAQVVVERTHDTATILLADTWQEWDKKTAKIVLHHELLHCLLDKLYLVIEDLQYQPGLSENDFNIIQRLGMYELERAIEAIQRIMHPEFNR